MAFKSPLLKSNFRGGISLSLLEEKDGFLIVLRIPEMIQKVVYFFPEWVAALSRNQWQVYSRMGGRFAPESTLTTTKDCTNGC